MLMKSVLVFNPSRSIQITTARCSIMTSAWWNSINLWLLLTISDQSVWHPMQVSFTMLPLAGQQVGEELEKMVSVSKLAMQSFKICQINLLNVYSPFIGKQPQNMLKWCLHYWITLKAQLHDPLMVTHRKNGLSFSWYC